MSILRRFASSAIAAGIVLGWVPGAMAQRAPQRLRLGTIAPQGTSYHHILQEMGERWRKATNEEVQLTIYAGTMGSELDMVRRMRLGQLHAASLSVTGLQEIDPGVSALQQMPMMFRSLDEVDFVRSRLEPVLIKRFADRGFVVLNWVDLGWVRYFTRRPALHPDDFRRLKVFVTAGQPEQYDLMQSTGFSPVSLGWSDALMALQTGMIDAVPTIPYFALAMQFHTVANTMLELNWLPLVGATIITKRSWDALSPETQTAMRSIAADAGRKIEERSRAESDEAVAAMRQRGLTVTPVPPAVEAEWRAMSERLYPHIRGTIVPADMFDEVVRVLAEYRAARPAR